MTALERLVPDHRHWATAVAGGTVSTITLPDGGFETALLMDGATDLEFERRFDGLRDALAYHVKLTERNPQ